MEIASTKLYLRDAMLKNFPYSTLKVSMAKFCWLNFICQLLILDFFLRSEILFFHQNVDCGQYFLISIASEDQINLFVRFWCAKKGSIWLPSVRLTQIFDADFRTEYLYTVYFSSIVVLQKLLWYWIKSLFKVLKKWVVEVKSPWIFGFLVLFFAICDSNSHL